MRPVIIFMVLFLWGGILLVSPAGGNPPSSENSPRQAGKSNSLVDGPQDPPPVEEQEVALEPFFFIRQKGRKLWVERVLVTLALPRSKNTTHNLQSPAFRKMIYELLHSEEPESYVATQAVNGLPRYLGRELNARGHITRSVVIVR